MAVIIKDITLIDLIISKNTVACHYNYHHHHHHHLDCQGLVDSSSGILTKNTNNMAIIIIIIILITKVLWTAPPAGSGCVHFRATVVEAE